MYRLLIFDRPRLHVAAAVLVIALVVGCSPAAKTPGEMPEPTIIGKILVPPPLNMAEIFGQNVSLRSPISEKAFVTGTVGHLAESEFSKVLVEALHVHYLERVVPTSQTLLDMQAPAGSARLGRELAADAMVLGQSNHADAVLISYIYAYQDRAGGAFGVSSPATVSFELNLIKSTSGLLVWTGRFSEEQQPLNENLLQFGKFFSRQGRWVTSREMAREGLNRLVKSMLQKYR